jgi:hypothetical protein
MPSAAVPMFGAVILFHSISEFTAFMRGSEMRKFNESQHEMYKLRLIAVI